MERYVSLGMSTADRDVTQQLRSRVLKINQKTQIYQQKLLATVINSSIFLSDIQSEKYHIINLYYSFLSSNI